MVSRMLARTRDRPLAGLGSAVVLALVLSGFGCTLTQRPSVKVVDPALRERGTELTRERRRGGYALGPYEIHDVGLRAEPPDPDGPLATEDARRPVSQHRAGLVLDAPSGRSWTTACILQRRPSVAIDYRAVLDENGDEIALDCVIKARGLPPWTFSARTSMSNNFVGPLQPTGGEQEYQLEVLTRVSPVRRLERLKRLLPVPVVQLRDGERAVLAALLGRPERAWVAEGLSPLAAEAGLALAMTLRVLPWQLAQ